MKKITLFLLFVSISLALSSYNLEFVRAEVNISVDVSGATAYVHVPFNDSVQRITQHTTQYVYSDEIGEYFKAAQPTTYSAIIEVNVSKISITKDAVIPLNISNKYTAPTEKIQSNDAEIKTKALEITFNAKTELEAVAGIVKWVYENIEYIESNETEVLSAKQVLEKKQGMCGDFSMLTAALLRSIGIPTKYVKGEIFTGTKFTPHAWLEVYVPESGWIPIDPTNGELMANAGRIKFMEGADPKNLVDTIYSTSQNYKYLKTIDINIKNYSEFSGLFNSSLILDTNQAGFGSYVKARLIVQNLKNKYLIPFVKLLHSAGLKVEKEYDLIILKSNETRKISWDILTPENLSKEYQYTFFLQAVGQGISENASLFVSAMQPFSQKPTISVNYIDKKIEEDKILISIEIENTGNVNITPRISVESGLGVQTKILSLNKSEKLNATFAFDLLEGVDFYNFTVKINYDSEEFIQPLYIDLSRAGVLELLWEIISTNINSIFTIVVIIVIIVVAFIFLTPLIFEPTKPFMPGKGVKVIEKKMFKEAYKKHSDKRKIEKSLKFLSEKEE